MLIPLADLKRALRRGLCAGDRAAVAVRGGVLEVVSAHPFGYALAVQLRGRQGPDPSGPGSPPEDSSTFVMQPIVGTVD